MQLSSTAHTSLFLAVTIVSIKSVQFLRKEKPYSVLSYFVSRRWKKREREIERVHEQEGEWGREGEDGG